MIERWTFDKVRLVTEAIRKNYKDSERSAHRNNGNATEVPTDVFIGMLAQSKEFKVIDKRGER